MIEHQVNLGAHPRTVEKRGRTPGQYRQKALEYETLPARADDRVIGELLERPDAEQRVNQTAITHIDFRGFHQTLAHIAMKGGSRRTNKRSHKRSI